ncbi:uncharacterized protein LOC126767198 [Bactrocera neohumeralis]|uniref:uncharacterized protein LOC126767198 n=1 Tax=Bactrocera neohumeralis TaxID=98809 RepID=UPI002164F9A3|nr:uncharacterized protein LOC126767198 [Bactrocera neohumeralis]
MTDFEEMALSTFGSAAVEGIQSIQSFGLTPIEQTIEYAIASPTGSPLQLCSQVEATPNSDHHPGSPSTPTTNLSLENLNASTSVISQLIRTLIADIPKRNAAEEERRREQREMMQAIQGLTNSITELIKSFTNNVK